MPTNNQRAIDAAVRRMTTQYRWITTTQDRAQAVIGHQVARLIELGLSAEEAEQLRQQAERIGTPGV